MTQEKNKYNFQKMTPTEVEGMRGYKESLDFVFEHEKLRNIAITGPYGSGKTSIIKTYEKLKKDEDFIYVSLAAFDKQDKNEKENQEKSTENNDIEKEDSVKLEGKILNQIIHQINPRKIPQTEFKTRVDITSKSKTMNFIFSSLFIFLTLFIVYFEYWANIVSLLELRFLRNFLSFTTTNTTLFIAIIINVIILGVFWYKFLEGFLHGKFLKRIKWDKSEIELFDEKNDSYFDKHLDEILYLFRKSNFSTIVFEDIDRFNMNQIFGRLREINNLINISVLRDSGNKTPIRFFYLLKDDMFISQERTKFFDFILPIIPVTDGSNSYNQLKEILIEGNLDKEFDEVFLERICLYIDDMRLLKNIYNEYLIYHTRLEGELHNGINNTKLIEDGKSIGLNRNKLFAMIVYKNVFPNDFTSLQYRRGFMFNLINNKQILINEKLNEIDEDKQQYKKLIIKINEEHLENINELDALFFKHPGIIMVNGKDQHEYDNRVQFIQAIKENNYDVRVRKNVNFNSNNQPINVEGVFDKHRRDSKYRLREKTLIRKLEMKEREYNNRLADLKRETTYVHSLKLKQLITSENIEHYLELVNPKEENKDIYSSHYYDLILFLTRNGYIDEDYYDYIAYFIPNVLTRNDKVFLRSVTDVQPKEFEFKLDDPARIVDSLKAYDFLNKAILNYDLLTYLYNHHHQYLDEFLKYLKKNKQFNFLFNYFDVIEDSKSIIGRMNQVWVSIIKEMLVSDEVSKVQVNEYIWNTLIYSDVQEIIAMNVDDCLTDFISQNEEFLSVEITDIDDDKVVSTFDELTVKFTNINYQTANKALFEAVYQNNLYAINSNTLDLMMNIKYYVTDKEELEKRNYSILMTKPDEPLYQYVQQCTNEYMEVILKNDSIKDSQEAIEELINHDNIYTKYKNQYIEQMETIIQSIRSIDSSYFEIIVESRKMEYTLMNLLDYFKAHTPQIDLLIEYINDVDYELIDDINLFKIEYNPSILKSFTEVLIKSKNLHLEKFREILTALDIVYEELKFPIDNEKLTVLIEEDLIEMNLDTLAYIKEHNISLMYEFILRNFVNYVHILNELEEVDEEELLSLIKHEEIKASEQLKLLEYISSEISLNSADYPASVMLKIINNHFSHEDIELLVANYSEYTKHIKNKILEISLKNIDEIINNDYSIDLSLLDQLFHEDSLTNEYKQALFYTNYRSLSLYEVKKYLKLSGLYEFIRLLNGKRPTFTNDEKNMGLLAYFKENNWISSYKVNEKDPTKINAFGNLK